jgi:hypothetical protein
MKATLHEAGGQRSPVRALLEDLREVEHDAPRRTRLDGARHADA